MSPEELETFQAVLSFLIVGSGLYLFWTFLMNLEKDR